MNRSWLTGLLAGLGVAVIFFAVSGALHAQNTPAPTGRIAIINVEQVINEYERWKDLAEEARQLKESVGQEDKNRQDAIQALGTTVDVMDRNDPAFVKKLGEFQETVIQHKTWQQVLDATMQRELALATDGIYRDLMRATKAVAEATGYDVVLYRDDYQQLADPTAIENQMRGRKVVYANEAINISQAVIDKLNADYRTQTPTPQLQVPIR